MAEEEVVENGVDAPEKPKFSLMTDSYEGMIKYQDETFKCLGAPNWRRLGGFPIYATGQPNQADLDKCVEQATNKFDEQKNLLWVNLRQEGVVYINGKPYSVRDTASLEKHMCMTEAFAINNLENDVVSSVKKGDGSYAFYKDQVGEQEKETLPAEYKEEKAKVESVSTLSELFSAAAKKEPKLESTRIPMNLNQAPTDETFDLLVRLFKGHSSAVPVIFNCQAGISRSSTASVVAAIIKETQLEAEFDKMRGIVPDEIIDGLRGKKLHPEIPPCTEANALMRGEFPVILSLLESSEQAKEAKEQVDRLIDAAAEAENIREAVAMQKMQFDVASDDWRLTLKQRIMDLIERYFMLIVFAMYTKEVGTNGFNVPFKKWLDSKDYRDMIAAGKGTLEWERKVPEEKIQDLKDLLKADDFDANLPAVINKINQLSYKMFNDLPRGDQKCKSMRKCAGRTLLEVLPDKLLEYLESKLGNLSNVPDFYDMVGTLSMYGKCPAVEE